MTDNNFNDIEAQKNSADLLERNIDKDLVFSILDELALNQCVEVRYSGGEPMLHPYCMEIFKYGSLKKLRQVLFTNGHFINEKNIQDLKHNNIKTILISIHGDMQTHNIICGHDLAYTKAINAMRLALTENIEVVAEMTLIQSNINHVVSIIDDIYNIGVREFRIMRYVPTGLNDERYAVKLKDVYTLIDKINNKLIEYKDLSIGWPCGQKFCLSEIDMPILKHDYETKIIENQLTGHCDAGITWASISYTGHLRCCPHSNIFFGNTNSGIKNNWLNMTTEIKNSLSKREACANCLLYEKCKGGCHLKHFYISTRGIKNE